MLNKICLFLRIYWKHSHLFWNNSAEKSLSSALYISFSLQSSSSVIETTSSIKSASGSTGMPSSGPTSVQTYLGMFKIFNGIEIPSKTLISKPHLHYRCIFWLIMLLLISIKWNVVWQIEKKNSRKIIKSSINRFFCSNRLNNNFKKS
jgi:hypothetical protein